MHLDLFKPNNALIDSPTKATQLDKEAEDNQHSLAHEDSNYQKYESPKFFIGSGSPVRRTSKGNQDDEDEERKE